MAEGEIGISVNPEEFVWENKFRPKTVNDCILPKHIQDKMEKVVRERQFTHMTFHSSPGTGKSTVAKAICTELDLDYIFINGSKEGRLMETVRNIVEPFISSMSVDHHAQGIKVVIYDEFDNSGHDVQKAIRGLIDESITTCRFIFTGNYVTKIIDPIISRTSMIDFSVPHKEKPYIMARILERCCAILEFEKIPYDKKVLATYIAKTFPDFRKILNELQSYSACGRIDSGILTFSLDKYKPLVDFIIDKDFSSIINWVKNNAFDGSVYSIVGKELYKHIDKVVWLDVIIKCDEYQYRHAFATDPDVTLFAFCASLMEIL
jgi:replication factor C small subunit